MHFVHVEDFFHPSAGYQVNLLSRLQVTEGHQVTVITSELEKLPPYLTDFFGRDNIQEKDLAFTLTTGVRIIRVPLWGYYSGRSIYKFSVFYELKRLAPDVVFVHCMDTLFGMLYVWYSVFDRRPFVLDCHMLEMASTNRLRNIFRLIYRLFVAPIIKWRRIPVIRVVDSDYVEKCLGIPLDRTILLSFGTDTEQFKPNAQARSQFRQRHSITPDAFVILYAGKLDRSKGGEFLALALTEALHSKANRKLLFVVVGNASGEYGAKVEAILAASKNRILRFPTQPYYSLAAFYQAADIVLYPRQCSMSFFEAQACGAPVLLESNEINIERVSHNNGILFKADDARDLRRAILEMADASTATLTRMSANARAHVIKNYDYVPIARDFTQVLISEAQRSEPINQDDSRCRT